MAEKKKFMWKGIKEENSSDRPEQLLISKLLRASKHVKDVYDVKTEYPVLFENEDGKKSGAVLDIVMLPYRTSIPPVGIRVNGRIHENAKKRIYDEDQRRYLELIGWIIYDIDRATCPEYWEPKKHDRRELMAITESILSWVD